MTTLYSLDVDKTQGLFFCAPRIVGLGSRYQKGVWYFSSLKQTDRANDNVLKGERYFILKCIVQNDML